jgi:hypothetical protein
MSSPLHQKLAQALQPFLPAAALEPAVDFIVQYKVALTVTRSRATKLGDYRHPFNGKGHRITVNGTLNRYAFLVTLVHEYAHLLAWERYKGQIKPHGNEWKQLFTALMQPYLQENVFPAELLTTLRLYFKNPRASSCADPDLMRSLSQYDTTRDLYQFLEELPENALFMTRQRRFFVKGEKRRTRIICTEKDSLRQYLFHPLTPVQWQKPD